jgi:hypothetical protein
MDGLRKALTMLPEQMEAFKRAERARERERGRSAQRVQGSGERFEAAEAKRQRKAEKRKRTLGPRDLADAMCSGAGR